MDQQLLRELLRELARIASLDLDSHTHTHHRGRNETEPPRIRLEEEYGRPRDSLYRHAKAFGLNDRRQSNLIGALETIIESGLNTDLNVTATNVIEAIKVHAKLSGQWVDLTEDIRRDFDGKSTVDIRHYAETGRWPNDDDSEPTGRTQFGGKTLGIASSRAGLYRA